ncbi:MAG TPA: ECF-type sigma factor [Pyrinomonadaceae bacterium]|nr:ECF-type sigma factor [Pyrinomonadaceae bacterium]
MNTTHQITDLLRAWNDGDYKAADKLMPLVDHELKKTARKYMSRERPNHILLQPTALINDAFAKLMGESKLVSWTSRRQFYAIVARRMRQVLYDYAGSEQAGHTEIDSQMPDKESVDIRKLHQALEDLAIVRNRAAKVVELRYFGGYTINEVAKMLEIGTATVELDWRFAKAWLFQALTRQ